MSTITITPNRNEDKQKIVPFDALIYPRDKNVAVLQGEAFGGQKFSNSVQYRTCAQIDAKVPLQELYYYKWTLEKINRFGKKYEEFLFQPGKGCSIDEGHLEILKLDTEARQSKLAELTTLKFVGLFNSICDNWVLGESGNPITFYRLLGGKYAVFEGRHRVAILCYKYRNSGITGFSTNKNCIRHDYYYREFRAFIRSLLKRRYRFTNS